MGGLLITPRKEDFDKLNAKLATNILREVTISESEMNAIARRLHGHKHNNASSKDNWTAKSESNLLKKLAERDISIGILHAQSIQFTLNGHYSAKGETVSNEQKAECVDGAILWNGNKYSELCFIPETKELTPSRSRTSRLASVFIGNAKKNKPLRVSCDSSLTKRS